MEGGERNIPSERRGCLKKTGEGERGGKGIGGSQAERGKGFVLEKRASTATGSPAGPGRGKSFRNWVPHAPLALSEQCLLFTSWNPGQKLRSRCVGTRLPLLTCIFIEEKPRCRIIPFPPWNVLNLMAAEGVFLSIYNTTIISLEASPYFS